MIIEMSHIYKDYHNGDVVTPVLKDVCFEMEQGEYVAIMGRSGSGKTTLMNLIGCLDRATSGAYLLDGTDVSTCNQDAMSDLRLRKVGFVFQNFQLLAHATALENVTLPLTYAGVSQKERVTLAKNALDRVGLSDRIDYLPSQLSGGQKQRVAIARAIINKPLLLLADEPTGALDTASGQQVMELFKELNQDGMSVLMITHDPQIAQSASRIVEIQDGMLK